MLWPGIAVSQSDLDSELAQKILPYEFSRFQMHSPECLHEFAEVCKCEITLRHGDEKGEVASDAAVLPVHSWFSDQCVLSCRMRPGPEHDATLTSCYSNVHLNLVHDVCPAAAREAVMGHQRERPAAHFAGTHGRTRPTSST
eukprot:1765102-Rhodomonas_salina.2